MILTTFLYEEGHKIYSCRRDLMTGEYDEWREEYNFDLKVEEEGVYSIDTICVNGEYYRRLSFGWDTWVDGIGSSITGIYSPKWTIIPGNLSVMEVLSVYDGDECIFTKADFKQPVVTGIQVMKTLPKFDNLIYDLQGRRIQPEALHKGIYIQNGKKFVVE